MCKAPHYACDVNQPVNVFSVVCLILVKTMLTLVPYFTRAILTYVRYGQVIGQCVNVPIHTFGIVHNFTKERGEIIIADVLSPPLNACEYKSLHFHLLVLFLFLLCFSIILFFLLLMCLPPRPTPSLPLIFP